MGKYFAVKLNGKKLYNVGDENAFIVSAQVVYADNKKINKSFFSVSAILEQEGKVPLDVAWKDQHLSLGDEISITLCERKNVEDVDEYHPIYPKQKSLSKVDAVKCSFCEKDQTKVKGMIEGPGVNICNECVDLCAENLRDQNHRCP